MKTRIITEEETLYESENDFHVAQGMIIHVKNNEYKVKHISLFVDSQTRIIVVKSMYEEGLEYDRRIREMFVNEEPITADNFFDRVSTWVKNMKVFNS